MPSSPRHLSLGGRYTLWTGDPGAALYLHTCLSATAAFPPLYHF